jgi:hypothetical protein
MAFPTPPSPPRNPPPQRWKTLRFYLGTLLWEDLDSLALTQLCRSWKNTGDCQFAPFCLFAHGKTELRPAK